MSVLRAAGKKFDVDLFLKKSSLEPGGVFRRGEQSRCVKKKSLDSGFNLDVSNASWRRLKTQIRDAEKFIQKNKNELRRLRRFPGVETLVLDFPLENLINKDFVACFWSIPESLIHLASAAGISLELSVYAVAPEPKLKKRRK